MVEVIHLDSSLLRGMLDSEDDREHRSQAKHLLNSSRVRFRVSILAIGEVIGKMAEERDPSICAEAAAELHRLLKSGRVDLYGMGKGNEVIALALELMEHDHRATPTDCMLVACALVDKSCYSFATSDQKILMSPDIWTRARSTKVHILDASGRIHKRGAMPLGKPANMMLRRSVSESPI